MSRKIKTLRSSAPNSADRAKEILACGTDVKYFINKYVKISHPTKGLIPFKLFPYQEDCLVSYQKYDRIIVNKSRQLGLSTVSAAYSLWMAIFQREKNILIIATKLDVAQNFIVRLKTMLDHLPSWLVMPKLVVETKKELVFSNGSKIKALSTGKSSARSESVSLLILDEAAHIEDVEELWLGLLPTLSTGGQAVLISSPSGVGTLFHKIWIGSQKNENQFHAIELPWTVHPEHDERWFEQQKAEILPAKGERGVAMELLCSFASSGYTFLNADTMDKLFASIQKPLEIINSNTGGIRNEVWIWKYPVQNHKYIIAGDVATGQAEDYSTFHIVDITEDEIVGDFQGKLPPDKFADVMIEYGGKYNNALLCAELNAVGIGTAIRLKDSKYSNLYYEKLMKNIYMSYQPQQDIQDEQPGLTVSPQNREEMIAKMEHYLRNGLVRCYSKRLYEEFQTFIYKKSGSRDKAMAQKGHRDDLVMALSIACSLYEASGKMKNGFEQNQAQWALVGGMSRNTQQLNPVTGRTSDGFFQMPQGQANTMMNQNPMFQKQMDSQEASLTKHSRVQNYNTPFWKQFDWLFRD